MRRWLVVMLVLSGCKKCGSQPQATPDAAPSTDAALDVATIESGATEDSASTEYPIERPAKPTIDLGPDAPSGKGTELVVRARIPIGTADHPSMSFSADKIFVHSDGVRSIDPTSLLVMKLKLGWYGELIGTTYLERMNIPVTELRATDVTTEKTLWTSKRWNYTTVVATSSLFAFRVAGEGLFAVDRTTGDSKWNLPNAGYYPRVIHDEISFSTSSGATIIDASGKDLVKLDGNDASMFSWSVDRVIVHELKDHVGWLSSYERAPKLTTVVWSHPVGGSSNATADPDAIVWVDRERESLTGSLTLFDRKTGDARWHTADFLTETISAVRLEKDEVWVLPSSGALRGLDRATGKEKWRFPIDRAESVAILDGRIWLLTKTELLLLEKPGPTDPKPVMHGFTVRSLVDKKVSGNVKVVVDGDPIETDENGIVKVTKTGDAPCVVQGLVRGDMTERVVKPCQGVIDIDQRSEPPCYGDCN